jgi:DNA-binding transcriptional regulator YhcF (GntR family)
VWAFSMDITLSDAPKYKQIMRILVSEMQERGMEPHARFYSESELKDRFQVSVPTIRMALKELIQEGLIYREHGKGTFISPPSVKDQVLIVGRFEESLPSREFGIVSFMQSLIGDGSTPPSGLMPVAINSRIFQQLAPDLKHSYPNAKGVLFFRDFNTVRSTYAHLEALDLPYIFYGSDSWKNGLGDRPTCFYSEATIIEIGWRSTDWRRKYSNYPSEKSSTIFPCTRKPIGSCKQDRSNRVPSSALMTVLRFCFTMPP